MNDSATQTITVRTERRSARLLFVKRFVQWCFSVWISPRIVWLLLWQPLLGRNRAFLGASERIAAIAGDYGVYCRQAFYRALLMDCGRDVYIGWQTTFSMREARIGEGVYIGRRCSLGYAHIDDDALLADGVQVLSGGHEHGTADNDEETHKDQTQRYDVVTVGRGAWIGTNAILMADVGAGSIVGAGAVVTKAVPPRCVAVGSPARVIKSLDEQVSRADTARDSLASTT